MPPILLLWAALFFVASASGVTAKTTRVSLSSAGVEGDNNSFTPASISPTGHFIAFESRAANLVPHDLGNHDDVFVRDRVKGTTARVSLNSAEKQGNGNS